jgi:hypothetical protein
LRQRESAGEREDNRHEACTYRNMFLTEEILGSL